MRRSKTMKTEYQYMLFSQVGDTGKTSVWDIVQKGTLNTLGQVKWYGPWRCYSFHTKANCVFNESCLDDIKHFIKQLMDARKQARYERSKNFSPTF
jgi:hypothetical protein